MPNAGVDGTGPTAGAPADKGHRGPGRQRAPASPRLRHPARTPTTAGHRIVAGAWRTPASIPRIDQNPREHSSGTGATGRSWWMMV